eukprot:753678-Hanusia_phi.AAC.1
MRRLSREDKEEGRGLANWRASSSTRSPVVLEFPSSGCWSTTWSLWGWIRHCSLEKILES